LLENYKKRQTDSKRATRQDRQTKSIARNYKKRQIDSKRATRKDRQTNIARKL
jgi:hypothetical protein